MPVVVNSNVQSLIAQRNLTNATSSLSKSTQRLSTGLRINSASDDAAGLFIAKGLESQLRGSQQCQTNIALGINVLQTAEGDLTTIQDNLLRIKDLATQAASGINSDSARQALANEVKARVAEIDRISEASNFNGMHLLDGNDTKLQRLRLQVGAGSDETNVIYIEDVFVNSDASSLGLIGGTATYQNIDDAFASATTAGAFIASCENAVNAVSSRRSNLGVIQSRLEMSNDALTTTIENLTASKSTIMDTDIAAETSEYTRSQILQQIASSMLMQANQAPSIALSLLGT